MKPLLLITFFVASIATNCKGQSSELYIFKDSHKEHLESARKARAEAREKNVAGDIYMRVRTQTSLSTAKMQVDMKKSHDTTIRVTDMNGAELAMLHQGELKEGQYEFTYAPEGNLRKPFVCQVMIDGKTEAMKVVKFNSF
ncbi:MAG: hypothetical protein K9G46_10590 [Flavobacteriales bacterium]|nr:hypothetical protein [Flavobacteriales bacterium]